MCESCSSLYDTREEAEGCEESHQDWVVEPVFVVGKKYPERLVLTILSASGTGKEKALVTIVYEKKEVIPR